MPAPMRGHAVARRRAAVRTSAGGDGEPPRGEAPVTTSDVTERPATAGPTAEAPAAGDANPTAPTPRVPAGPPSPTATATSAPVSTRPLSRDPAPTTVTTDAPAANPVTTDSPTPTVKGAAPTVSVKPSSRSVAVATAGVARASVARVAVSRARNTPEPAAVTPAHTRALARSPLRRLGRAAVGGASDRSTSAALDPPRSMRISRRAVPDVERPFGLDTHTRTASPGEAAPASTTTAGIPGKTRPPVRAHTRVTRPSASRTASAAVAAGATATVANTATATAPIPARGPEPEPTASRTHHPLANVLDRLANVPDRPSGQSLARAIGVTRESDGSGRSTVVFPQPRGRGIHSGTSMNARPLARQIELEPASLNGHGPDAAPSSAAEPSAPDAVEFEELYDRVLSRLRRDLVVERERRGDLAGSYFH